MMRTVGCLLGVLLVGGCGQKECTCPDDSNVSIDVPSSVAATVTDIQVGPAGCGVRSVSCVEPWDGPGCSVYAIYLSDDVAIDHACQVTASFSGNRTSTTTFTWRMDSYGCCPIRTFKPGRAITLPLPTPPDGGAAD